MREWLSAVSGALSPVLVSLSAPRNITRLHCSLVTDGISIVDDTGVIKVNEKWNINRLHVCKTFYHTSGSGLRTSQKHQPCEEALTNVWARGSKKKEKEREGIVCRCLGRGVNMWLSISKRHIVCIVVFSFNDKINCRRFCLWEKVCLHVCICPTI